MPDPVIIVGAGGIGRFLARNLKAFRSGHEVVGFLDDDTTQWGRTIDGYPVMGPTEAISDHGDVAVLIAVGDPLHRRRMVLDVSKHKVRFPSIVAPTAWVSEGVHLSAGVIVYPGVSINHGTTVGEFCIVNMNCAIGHDCDLAGYDTVGPGVNLAGFTVVGRGVELGIGSCTTPNVRIGAGALVGAGAVVIDNVKPNSVVVGVPARAIRSREEEWDEGAGHGD